MAFSNGAPCDRQYLEKESFVHPRRQEEGQRSGDSQKGKKQNRRKPKSREDETTPFSVEPTTFLVFRALLRLNGWLKRTSKLY